MRLYRGDITKFYEKAVWPVGAKTYIDGKEYTFCSVTGAKTIKKYNAVQIDNNFAVSLANGTVVDGVAVLDVDVPASTTYYVWVQTGGNGYVAVDDAETGSIENKLIDCSGEDGRAQAYSFSAAAGGSPTDAELNAMLLVARTCKILGQGATTFSANERVGDVDSYASYDNATTTVNGTNTSFTKWFEVGDKIVLSGTELTITAITNDTTMTVSGGSADISATNLIFRQRRIAPVEIIK